MDDILKFLLSRVPFLYKERGFRIVDSLVAPSFGGDAYLVMQSNELCIRFVSDRAQLFLDFQAKDAAKGNEWYSIDVVYQLITGQPTDSAELSDRYANFLATRYEEIAHAFSKSTFKQTTERLRMLKKERSKHMFG